LATTRAFYDASILQFISESPDTIIGRLTKNHTQDLVHDQQRAWSHQIILLQQQLQPWTDGWIFFEFIIPRMGSRADVVIFINGVVFVLEFKIGTTSITAADLRQTEGYCLDLHHFHAASHDRPIVPILIATESKVRASQGITPDFTEHDATVPSMSTPQIVPQVCKPIAIDGTTLHLLVQNTLDSLRGPTVANDIDGAQWAESPYHPTPTIIEAAEALYANHNVYDIARNDAGAENLASTSSYVRQVIESSLRNSRKSIVFLTGVPGSGKTLAGLNIATSAEESEHAVFLSGNGPLVEVLREALARDDQQRTGIRKADAKRKVSSFVQNIHRFRDEALRDQRPPVERVAVFDEAQRAWDQRHTAKFMAQKRNQHQWGLSEPEFLIGVMDRHRDWAVIVALVGSGQEINAGEAGLPGCIAALDDAFPAWDVHYSDRLDPEYGHAFRKLRNPVVAREPSLHLAVSIRSFRAERLSEMVHAVVNGEAATARSLYDAIEGRFPIAITRDLTVAKSWIRDHTRGTDRSGVVASSGAIRLRPFGITVKQTLDAPVWFLNEPSDIRSSNFLENVATEFDIQGLELDWCLVAWDADLRYVSGGFEHWRFSGTKWQRVQQEAAQRFLENAYRVLLTRARQGIVIFVPHGDPNDATRMPEFYDETYAYLIACGLHSLDVQAS